MCNFIGSSVINLLKALTIKNSLLTISNVNLQQSRNTYVLKRRFAPMAPKIGRAEKRLKKKHFIYDLVENKIATTKTPIDLILLQYVEGYGNPGDLISAKPLSAYKKFLLPKLADYATPENIEKYKKILTTRVFSSLYANKTIQQLSKLNLKITMNKQNPWTIEPWHIKTSFHQIGFQVPIENIELPNEPISGPNLDIDNKIFFVKVTINNCEKVDVRCILDHYSPDDDFSEENEKVEATEYIFPPTSSTIDKNNDININK